jgi:hypothetical protein
MKVNRVAISEVRSRGKMAKNHKKGKSIAINKKKKWTMINPIWCDRLWGGRTTT